VTAVATVRRPLHLKLLTPAEARRAFETDPRLIIPVGTCEHHGEHLPLGCDTLVVERLADDLSAEFGILVAPTVEYGVNFVTGQPLPGSAAVRRKTLRRWVNDLLLEWERQGVREFLILTAHGHAPHQEALGTVVTEQARVRVIDILSIDLGTLIERPEGPIHGGEVDTSLALFVAPHLVRMAEARDFILPDSAVRRYRRGSSPRLPRGSDAGVGVPTRASAEKGQRIFEFIKERIRSRVLSGGPAADDT
jgi:creatinine amidohydrolase